MTTTELFLVATATLCVGGYLVWLSRRTAGGWIAWPLLIALGVACLAWESWRVATISQPHVALASTLREEVPELSRPDTYVSSSRCRACHPGEYHSWHRTYHRTMTQLALPGNVLSDFKETTVLSSGLEYRVFRRGDEYWAEMPDPDMMLDVARGNPYIKMSEIPHVERRVLMTTGSHHYQTYWVASEKFDTVMQTLPLVYLPRQKQWIPREAAFMVPPDDAHRRLTIWNDHCINCHSTGGVPGLKGPLTLQTSVGELGIACEACHGPAEDHVTRNRDFIWRYGMHSGSTGDPTIVNPARLDHRRSSQVCGQCHGVYIRDEQWGMKYAREGVQYRPGEDLHEKRHYIEFPTAESPPDKREEFHKNRDFFRDRWWDDGTILAGGREYTAISKTGCFQKGQMSCLSCHSMHQADPNDQVTPGRRGNLACTGCHQESKYTSRISEHTHHAAGSSGSNCLNCHMPHTSYALFNAIRNHTISVPHVASSARHGVPNACNLCHLDQTLAWTEETLADWYGHDRLVLDAEQETISAALLWMLKGHAAQRAISAWHFGWQPARQVSGDWWMAPFLAQLLRDPYGVVRYVANESLRQLTGQTERQYDFLGTDAELAGSSDDILADWRASRTDRFSQTSPSDALLINDDGDLQVDLLQRLLAERDNRPVTIKE